MHDSAINREARINFIQQLIQKTSPINDFSCYKAIDEKIKKLISQSKISSLFKNEELIYSGLLEKRVLLSASSKHEEKKKKKSEREKDTKSKKRSAQLAEISVM